MGPRITVTETHAVPASAVNIRVGGATDDRAKVVKETVVKETVTLRKSDESDD